MSSLPPATEANESNVRFRIRDTASQDRSVGIARRRNRFVPLAIGASCLLLFGIAWASSGRAFGGDTFDAEQLRVATVRRGDLVRDVPVEGRVIAANSPTLYAVSGGIVELRVVAGDKVAKGQALATIDSPELRSRLAQERFTLASLDADARRSALDAQMLRSNARKTRDKAQIDRTAANREVERYRRAYERGAIPQVDLARAEDELQKAEVGVRQADEDLGLQSRAGELDAENKRLLADRQREVVAELEREVTMLTLVAPFDGQVGQVQAAQRENLAANAPVLTVVDLAKFDVEARVPEVLARELEIGMPARIADEAGGYAASVSAISPEVANGQVTTRLRFAPGQQPRGLRQSQRLSARILVGTRRNVLMLERGPFYDRDGASVVYVVDGDVAMRRPVQVGTSSLADVEIVSGLRVGEQVVVSGTQPFRDAERVSLAR